MATITAIPPATPTQSAPSIGSTIHLPAGDVPAIFKRAYPDYRGRTWKVCVATEVELTGNYWSGGSRSTYRGLDLATGKVFNPAHDEYGNPFTCPDVPTVTLSPGVAIVSHSIYCGKDHGLTIYAHPDNVQKLLPAPTDLSEDERRALDLICSTRGGECRRKEWDDYRRLPGKYSAANPLIVSLADKGLVKVNKAGAVAVTLDGRNANRR